MSLPKFDTQGSLFESLGSIAADLFDQKDKYKLFARKVWPLLAGCREELAQRYLESASLTVARVYRALSLRTSAWQSL